VVSSHAPAERQWYAYGILVERVDQLATVDADSDPHAVRNKVALEHRVGLMPIRLAGSGVKSAPNPVAVAHPAATPAASSSAGYVIHDRIAIAARILALRGRRLVAAVR